MRWRSASERYTADKILIATGGWPHIPEFPGSELAISSNEVFDLEQFPQRLAIVGGGYIAVEFAGIFNGLGARVSQLYRGPLFLRGFDTDIRAHAAQEIRKTGVDLRFEVNVQSITAVAGGLQVALTDDSTSKSMRCSTPRAQGPPARPGSGERERAVQRRRHDRGRR
jgi:glutathione reductase (NADPH)